MTDSEKLDLLLLKMEGFATKDDLKSFATTEQRLNRRFEEVDKKILDLRNYVTSMRYSSEAVEILMKRQDNVEQRLQKVERKVLYS